MKAYKGFNKDMTCRGFQFEEGKEYHEDNAELCKSGFHACENPLDCFSYYVPANSVFHEVELDDVSNERQDDSKVCGKHIKIGASLNVADICKLHFEYTKSKTTNAEQGKDNTNLSAQDYSSLSARDCSSLSARDCSSLSAQDYSSLSAQDESSLSARNCSSLSAQDYSSLSARDCSSLSAQDYSSLSAQDESSLSARNCSSLSAQDESSLSAGRNSIIAAFNSRAKGGLNTLIALANRKFIDGEYKIIDFKAEIVDGERIKPDTWYTLENGEFVEAEK